MQTQFFFLTDKEYKVLIEWQAMVLRWSKTNKIYISSVLAKTTPHISATPYHAISATPYHAISATPYYNISATTYYI